MMEIFCYHVSLASYISIHHLKLTFKHIHVNVNMVTGQGGMGLDVYLQLVRLT